MLFKTSSIVSYTFFYMFYSRFRYNDREGRSGVRTVFVIFVKIFC